MEGEQAAADRFRRRDSAPSSHHENMKPSSADIGVVGMAVMGRNLALNIADHGFATAVFNRSADPIRDTLRGASPGQTILAPIAADSAVDQTTDDDLRAFLLALKRPRRLLLMIKAGRPVDQMIERILGLGVLEEGDIVIDGGNSLYTDTQRRLGELAARGILFVGCGISGGEEGARRGPSMMPGGAGEAWEPLRPILQSIAAKARDGAPCCDWIGDGGAGHFVKMVHNGIEYGDMQLIAETYQLLRDGLGLAAGDMAEVFARWNGGPLESFLIEITADILRRRDDDGEPLVDKVLDAAGMKGTGSWTVANALELGEPLTLIGEAVFARSLSARKEERVAAEAKLGRASRTYAGDPATFLADLERALLSAKIVSYAQGFAMMRGAGEQFGWSLDFGAVAGLWRGGCIIRSVFLEDITAAFRREPALANLVLDNHFARTLADADAAFRKVVASAVTLGIPVPAFSSALAWLDGYRSARLPANLIQAQRDYFGAHTYERVDRPRGEFFHSDWAPNES
jgi:6-phosphogluconate dehydrogenase